MGGERPGQGAAVERLQHRGLDLEEAVLVEPATDLGDGPGPDAEDLAAVLVGDQVELAAAVAGLGVLEAVELVRRRAQRFGQQLHPSTSSESWPRRVTIARPVDADEVAEVEVVKQGEGAFAEHVGLGVELDLAGTVAQVDEGGLAVAAAADDPAGDPVDDRSPPRPSGRRALRVPTRSPRGLRSRAGTGRSRPR